MCTLLKALSMKYDKFTEVLPLFPTGRFTLNSLQLRDVLSHGGCTSVCVRVLNLGTMPLNREDVIKRLDNHAHPRVDNIKITCLDGEVIIDEPNQGR